MVSFPFSGSLLLTELDHFNDCLRAELKFHITRPSPALHNWLKAPIEDVFLITEKKHLSFGNEHALLEVQTIYRTRFHNYYEMKAWISEGWDQLLDISIA